VFDNSYFKYIKEQNDSELLVLETDDVLFKDEGFR
jgi:L-ascorbate peroxidase